MAFLGDVLGGLERAGLSDIIIPFILIYTLVFAILKKSKVLGEDSHKFNVVLALIMGLAVVIPHNLGLYGKPSVVDIINQSLPNISLLVVVVVMFLILVGIFAKDFDFAGASFTAWAVFLALIAVILIFGSNAGWFILPSFLHFITSPYVQEVVVTILVLGLLIAFITGDSEGKHKREGFNRFFTDILGKK